MKLFCATPRRSPQVLGTPKFPQTFYRFLSQGGIAITDNVIPIQGDTRKGAKPYEGKKVPEFEREMPEMPEFLTAYAKREWNRLVPALHAVGILAGVDAGLLASYCEAVSTLKAATDDVKRRGVMVASAREDGAMVKNPAVGIQRDAMNTIRALGKQLGIEPGRRKPDPKNEPAEGSLAALVAAELAKEGGA